MNDPSRQAKTSGPGRPIIFLGTGVLLALLSAANIVLLALPARVLAPDGEISAALHRDLHLSQLLLGIVLIPAGLGARPLGQRAEEWLSRLTHMSQRRFLLLLGVTAGLLTLSIQIVLFANIPHVTDAISHLFQARIIVLGRPFAPAPPCVRSFFQHHVIITSTGKWFSKYTPGHPLWLAAGLILRAPWLMGPLATALAGIYLTRLIQAFYGVRVGRVSGALFVMSPLALLLGASFMSHMTFLMFVLSASFYLKQAIDRAGAGRPDLLTGIGSGLLFGCAALTRPHEFLMAGPIVALALLLAPSDQWKLVPRLALPVAIGLAPALLLDLWWNSRLYGHWLALGYGFTSEASLTPIAQGHYGFTSSFSPREALTLTLLSLAHLNKVLLGWPSSLCLVPLTFLRRHWDRRDMVCAAGVLVVLATYFPYSYYAREYEARYYFAMTPFLLPLTVRGLAWLRARGAAAGTVAALVTACVLHALVYYWPVYIWPRYARDYEQTTPIVHQLAKRAHLQRAVVLIRSTRDEDFRYNAGFLFNDPLLAQPVIYARDLPDQYACLREAFPHRTLYRFLPNADWTGGRFEAVPAPRGSTEKGPATNGRSGPG